MAIGTMVAFLLIVFLCAMLFWANRSARIHPFLISIDNMTGGWAIVGHDHGRKTVSATQSLQESVVGNFVRDWLFISDDAAANDAIWRTCDRTADCGTGDSAGLRAGRECAIYCTTSDDVFSRFVYDVIPDYQERAAVGERWNVDIDTMNITPTDDVADAGGTWRVMVSVVSNISAPMDVIAYVKVARNVKLYPRTLGFYVVDFNAYKLN